jgi:hypothetical protein
MLEEFIVYAIMADRDRETARDWMRSEARRDTRRAQERQAMRHARRFEWLRQPRG